MLIKSEQGSNGLQPCKPSATLHSGLPSRDLKSGHDYFGVRQSQTPEYRQNQVSEDASLTPQAGALRAPRYQQEDCSSGHPILRQHQVRADAVSTLQAESLRAPRYQQRDRSSGHQRKESRVLPEHLELQSDNLTYKPLESECPQGSHLQAGVNKAPSLRVSSCNQRKPVPADRKCTRFRGSKNCAYLLTRKPTRTLGLAARTGMTRRRTGRVPVAQVKGTRRPVWVPRILRMGSQIAASPHVHLGWGPSHCPGNRKLINTTCIIITERLWVAG